MKRSTKNLIAGGLMLFALTVGSAFGTPVQAADGDEYVMISYTSTEGNVKVQYKYDEYGRVTERSVKEDGSENVDHYVNNYHIHNGSLVSVTREENGKFYEKEVYDEKGKLVSAKRSSSSDWEQYVPTINVSAGSMSVVGFSTSAYVKKESYKNGKLVSAKWYDKKGKLVVKASYDKKGNPVVIKCKGDKVIYKNTYKNGVLSKCVEKHYTDFEGANKHMKLYYAYVNKYYTSGYRAGQLKSQKWTQYYSFGTCTSESIYSYKQDPVSKKIAKMTVKDKDTNKVSYKETYTYEKLSDLIQ